MTTLVETKARIIETLTGAGIEPVEARRESELIVEHATGWRLADQILHADDHLNDQPLAVVAEVLEHRCKRMPIQYVLGYAYFMGRKFKVAPGVLIPRTDTEPLVLKTLSMLEGVCSPEIAEIGIGSGIIAISMLLARADALVVGIDIAQEPMVLSQQNALHYQVQQRLKLIHGDWTNCLPEKLDAIVSNPPYIPSGAMEQLAPEIIQWEPAVALLGSDHDGLGFYRQFSQVGFAHLKPGGFIALEVGDTQAEAVCAIFKLAGWQKVQMDCDFNQLPRIVTAVAPGAGFSNS